MPETIRYGGDLRILIVGGGIAGLTLAALLRQRGFRPDIVEKTQGYGGVGYVIGLWPAGSSILKGLGLYPRFAAAGREFATYAIATGQGAVLHRYGFHQLAAKYGPTYLLQRAELIAILHDGLGDLPIRMGTRVAAIEQTDGLVTVRFTDGSDGAYDLVVGADGIYSRVRSLLFGEVPLRYAGMTSWAFWLRPSFTSPHEVIEYWGTGRFFGIYPARDVLCCFIAMKAPAGLPDPPSERIACIREHFGRLGGLVPSVLAELERPEDIWHDDFFDLTLPRWRQGRVVLIGDAGAAFLPTAGVGASMAMESAAVLADELSRADSCQLDHALDRFIARRRPRTDRMQRISRTLAHYMLSNRPLEAAVRNALVRLYPEQRMLASWSELLSGAI